MPEIKGQPGNVRLYNPPSDNSEGAIESPPLARRSFFRVQEVEFSWARNGVALLVLGSSEVDATNQSYYGESSLHFMRTDGELDCKVKRLHHIFFGIHLHDNERYTANTEHCGCFQQYQVPLDKEGPCMKLLGPQTVRSSSWSMVSCRRKRRYTTPRNVSQSINLEQDHIILCAGTLSDASFVLQDLATCLAILSSLTEKLTVNTNLSVQPGPLVR